jgi:hypothetical protein
VNDDPGLNGFLGADRGVCVADLPGPDQGFRAKRSQQSVDLAADGVTPLWEHGPWVDDESPWIKGKDGDLRRMYGLTIDWWAELLDAQNWRCAACKRGFRFTFQCPPGYPRPPHVDHDHQTGEIRGLLCGRCNRKLSQGLTRYVLNPPARRLGPWVVPAKQRQYGLALYAKRTRRQQMAQELAELALTVPRPGPILGRCPSSTGSGP